MANWSLKGSSVQHNVVANVCVACGCMHENDDDMCNVCHARVQYIMLPGWAKCNEYDCMDCVALASDTCPYR